MAANENLLEVKNLEVIYTANGETVQAVNDVSFSIRRGETLALVGETGAGKTTIAKAVMRILPDPPAKILQGSIKLENQELTKLSEEEMCKVRGDRIAMIFQDPMTALNPLQTVGEQIMEGLMLHNEYSKPTCRDKAGDMLEMVGIPRRRLDEYPFQFSGGMRQRVVIAMALACNPDLLLADEPTTALDVTIQAQVLELIKALKEKMNSSMLLITHDLGIVAQTSDVVAVIYAGEIIEYGPKRAIFKETAHPYTHGLFGSLPGANINQKRLTPIPGSMPDPTNLPEGCKFSPRCPYATEACHKNRMPLIEISEGHFSRCDHRNTEVKHG